MIVAQGGGPFRIDGDSGILAQGQRGLILKLLEHTRKALGQLYADPVPGNCRRLLYARWKPPEQFVVTPEGVEEVTRTVRFPHFEIVISHTDEEPDQTPQVKWE